MRGLRYGTDCGYDGSFLSGCEGAALSGAVIGLVCIAIIVVVIYAIHRKFE